MKDTRNVAIVTSSYLPVQGGVQYLLYWMLLEIDAHYEHYQKTCGFDTFFFICPAAEEKALYDFKHIQVLHVQEIHIHNLIHNCIALARFVRTYKLHVLHAHNALTDGIMCYVASLVSNCIYMITSHGIDLAYDSAFAYGARLKRMQRYIITRVLHRAAIVTTISNDMLRFVHEVVSPEKTRLVPNSYNPFFSEIQDNTINDEVARLKTQYHIDENDTVYLTLSGARRIKGHEPMLQGFKQALATNPHMKLLIGAEGTETETLKKSVKEKQLANHVYFIGFVTGKIKEAFFTLADVYCNTAYFEPFGLTYLEAMQNDIAVLGSIYGGGADIFTHKKTAYLVDPYKIDTITDGFLALSDPNTRNALQKSYPELLTHYSLPKVTSQYMTLYRELLHD